MFVGTTLLFQRTTCSTYGAIYCPADELASDWKKSEVLKSSGASYTGDLTVLVAGVSVIFCNNK